MKIYSFFSAAASFFVFHLQPTSAFLISPIAVETFKTSCQINLIQLPVTPQAWPNGRCVRKLPSPSIPSIPSIPPNPSTRLYFFGNLFGYNNEEDQKDLGENELARFSNLSSSDSSVKYDSLSIMISEWSKLFSDDEDGKKRMKMGLTTPVSVVKLSSSDASDGDVQEYSCVQLLFQKTKVGGASAYDDKDNKKDKHSEDEVENEEVPIKEGGVEVRVEKLPNGELQVVAQRCNIEEGTMIKEMSEQTILESLRKAVAAWRKEQS